MSETIYALIRGKGAHVPKVGNKHYPYTAKGKAAAKKAKAGMKKGATRKHKRRGA